MKTNRQAKSIVPGLAVSLGCCFMLFIYAPFELYLTNRSDFWFKPGQMLLYCGALFLCAMLLCLAALLICRKLGAKLLCLFTAFMLWLLLAFYIQGNFLISGLPGLDGTEVNWGAYPAERLKSVLCWVLTALAVLAVCLKLGYDRFCKVSSFAGFGLFLLLALTLGTLALTAGTDDRQVLAPTDAELFTMSREQNMIVVHLDAVDAGEFEKVMAADSEYREAFSDFTYFDNTLSGYPYTKCSIPFILTGQWFEAQQSYDEYVDSAMDASPIINALEQEDFRIGIYHTTEFFLSKDTFDGRIENLVDDDPKPASHKDMAVMMLRMGMVKFAPWDLKIKGYRLQDNLLTLRVFGSSDSTYYDYSNEVFYDRVKSPGCIDLRAEKSFKYITLEGAHVPFRFDKSMNQIPDATYYTSVEGTLTMASALLTRMKEAGVYDNSVIVLMADHGYNELEDDTNIRQHPMLMIKGLHEHHDFRTDSAPVSHADLQDAFIRLLHGAESSECFDWHEGDQRERRFLDYSWRDLSRFVEYVQTGRAEDMSTLKPTGKIFEG